jgi:leucyl aminopeptidase (aminopeptidase T)
MTPEEYARCARRISASLQLEPGERVLIKLDPRTFAPLVEPLQQEIRKCGAIIGAVVLAEDTKASSEQELVGLRALFNDADVFIWLPELNQGNRPALAKAIVEWLDARRGRAVHFHWHSGSYPIGDMLIPSPHIVDQMYLAALNEDPSILDRQHRTAIEILRSENVRVTTPEGTDLRFNVGDRPFSSQIGDASRGRMQSARTRIDRDVELPAGVLRVAPIETTAEGTVFLRVWRPIFTQGRNLLLHFRKGCVQQIEGENAGAILQELTAAGGAARMFREFALGFNQSLAVDGENPFIAYYGYGAGVVRLSLGDNEEMGGANRGGGVYWNFLHNATVTVGTTSLVKDGRLQTVT